MLGNSTPARTAGLFPPFWQSDRLRRRSLLISLAIHLALVVSVLGWDALIAWWNQRTPIPETSPPASESRLVYAPPPTQAKAIRPELIPSATALPQHANALPPTRLSTPLRPLLNQQRPEGSGAGEGGGKGDKLETPRLPPAMALPMAPSPQSGGGQRDIPLQQRQEQEANYILMGLLLRQYKQHWMPIYGDRLPRRTFYLWVKHDNSRVVAAQFVNGSSSGIEALDRLIIGWLKESNKIDLSNLSYSEPELLMTVDLYQAHR